MAKTTKWNEVAADADYQALSDNDQAKVKQRFYDNVVAKDSSFAGLPAQEQESVRTRFFGVTPQVTEQPQEAQQPQGFLGQAKDTILTAAKATAPAVLGAVAPGLANVKDIMHMSSSAQEAGGGISEFLGSKGVPAPVSATAGFVAGIALDPMTYATGGAARLGPVVPRVASELEQVGARFGLSLTKGEMLDFKPMLLLERALENTAGGAKYLKVFRENRLEQLNKLRDTLVSREASPQALEKIGLQIQDTAKKLMTTQEAAQTGMAQSMLQTGAQKMGVSSEGAAATGSKALEAIRNASIAASDDVNKAFSEVEAVMPQNFAQRADATVQAAKLMRKKLDDAQPSLRDEQLGRILNDFIPKSKPGSVPAGQALPQATFTWAQLKANREVLTQLINGGDGSAAFGVKGGTGVSTAALGRLKTAISQDMETMAQTVGGDVSEKYAVARVMHGNMKQTFDNDTIRSLIKTADTKPELFISQVFAPGRTTELNNVRKIIGTEKFNGLKDRFTTTLFGMDKDQAFNPAMLRQQVARYGKEMLTETYGPKGYQDLTNLALQVEKTGTMPIDNVFARALIARSPEKVMDFVIRPGNTGNIVKARQLVGEQVWKESAASWLDQSVLAKNPDAIVNPAQFVKLLDKYGHDTIKAAVGDRQFKTIAKIGAVSRLIQKAEQVSVNTSNTAGVGAMMKRIVSPVGALMEFVGSRAIAKWYLDPKASQILLEGLSAMPKSRAAISAARQLAAISGVQLAQEGVETLQAPPAPR